MTSSIWTEPATVHHGGPIAPSRPRLFIAPSNGSPGRVMRAPSRAVAKPQHRHFTVNDQVTDPDRRGVPPVPLDLAVVRSDVRDDAFAGVRTDEADRGANETGITVSVLVGTARIRPAGINREDLGSLPIEEYGDPVGVHRPGSVDLQMNVYGRDQRGIGTRNRRKGFDDERESELTATRRWVARMSGSIVRSADGCRHEHENCHQQSNGEQ